MAVLISSGLVVTPNTEAFASALSRAAGPPAGSTVTAQLEVEFLDVAESLQTTVR